MDTQELLNELKKQLINAFEEKYKDLTPQLEQDINDFIKTSEGKIIRWATLLSTNTISQEELNWLLKSQQDIMELQMLQSSGISKIKLNTIKNTIIKTVFQVVITNI